MMYEFVGHYWRIDTAPAAPDTTTSGLLELSIAAGTTSTANLNPGLNVWNKEGYDFTDIQVATEFWDNDAIDEDGIYAGRRDARLVLVDPAGHVDPADPQQPVASPRRSRWRSASSRAPTRTSKASRP